MPCHLLGFVSWVASIPALVEENITEPENNNNYNGSLLYSKVVSVIE